MGAERVQQELVPCPLCGSWMLLKNSGIPLAEYYDIENRRAKKFDVTNLVDKEPFLLTTAYIRQIAEQIKNGQGLYLYGRNGSGKTMLACMIGIAATETLHKVKFGLSAKFLDDIRACWGNDGQATARSDMWREEMNNIPLLIIDDLGSENKGGGWAAAEFFRLLNDRLAKGKATIITSQLSLTKIRQGLAGGDDDQAHRLASRIEPMIAVEVVAKRDYRQAQGDLARQKLLDSLGV